MNLALDLHPGRLHLLVAPHPVVDRLTDIFIARLALAGPVHVLDGGNRFDAHQIARSIRRQTVQMEAALERITIARAFTCYQMAALLANHGRSEIPVLVLNLLVTFGDENVPGYERTRLLHNCIADLKCLAARSPVLVSAAPASTPAGSAFLDQLGAAVSQTWRLEVTQPPIQARLM